MTKEVLLTKLGERIAKLRDEQSLSQTDLAHMCDWDRQVLHKIEKGKINSSIFVYYRIAIELKISLSKLLEVE